MGMPGHKYCGECGAKLVMKMNEREGREVPWCPTCGDYRFPLFNVNCSMIVMNPDRDKILLIKQYGKDRNILVAGYVGQGEDAENTVAREIREELGVGITAKKFNRTHYHKATNVLMINWTVVLETEDIQPNEEIDSCAWYSIEDARREICQGSLAQEFLEGYLKGGVYDFNHKIIGE